MKDMHRKASAELNIHVEKAPRRASKRPKSVAVKTVTTNAGTKTRVTTIDANSPTFGADFLYVFKNNVRRARKNGSGGEK